MTEPLTLGTRLERDRLLHRAARIERAIAALRDRDLYRHGVTGTAPAPLRSAVSDFSSELARVRQRLAQLPG